jgi:hypothetical protein
MNNYESRVWMMRTTRPLARPAGRAACAQTEAGAAGFRGAACFLNPTTSTVFTSWWATAAAVVHRARCTSRPTVRLEVLKIQPCLVFASKEISKI